MGLLSNLFKPTPPRTAFSGPPGDAETAEDLDDDIPPMPEHLEHPATGPARSIRFGGAVSGSTVSTTSIERAIRTGAAEAPAPAGSAPTGENVRIELAQAVPPIPAGLLRPEAPREILVSSSALMDELANGRAALRLSRLLQLCPEVFATNATPPADDPLIVLPLRAVVEQISSFPPREGQRPEAPLSERFAAVAVEKGAMPVEAKPPEPAPPAAKPAPSRAAMPAFKPAVGERKPSPAPSARRAAAEPGDPELIQLSLAAIVAKLPPNLATGSLRSVPETARIAFPFAPLEAQLGTGRVEISLEQFVAALPEEYRGALAQHRSVKIPIPLEEIFLNLPSQVEPAPKPKAADAPPAPEVPKTEPADSKTPTAQSKPVEEKQTEPKRPEAKVQLPATPPPMPASAEVAEPITIRVPPRETPPAAALVETPETTPPPPAETPAEPVPAPEPLRATSETTLRKPEPAPAEAPAAPPVAPVAPLPAAAQAEPAPSPETPEPEAAPAAAPRISIDMLTPPRVHLAPVPAPRVFAREEEAPPEPAAAEPLPDQPEEPRPPFDPAVAQAALMTDDELDAQKIAQLIARLPGLTACLIAAPGGLTTAGEIPPGFNPGEIREIARDLFQTAARNAARLGTIAPRTVTLHGEPPISLFLERGVCLAVLHTDRGFLPGVREKLLILAEQVALL